MPSRPVPTAVDVFSGAITLDDALNMRHPRTTRGMLTDVDGSCGYSLELHILRSSLPRVKFRVLYYLLAVAFFSFC